MKVSVLFSGGKDSSLSAILLEQFFEIELITCTFGILPTEEIAKKASESLGFSHRIVKLDIHILEDAYEFLLKDGYPRGAINHIHHEAVKKIAQDNNVSIIADGTRRDDRVPVLTIGQIRSIEDKSNIRYMCPLKGYGKAVVDFMVSKYLVIEEGQSIDVIKADYEAELREMVRQKHGSEMEKELFPPHVQSYVIGRKIYS